VFKAVKTKVDEIMTQSAVILTHHKAASTLLRRLIMLNYDFRFRNVDYAGEYWSAKTSQRTYADVYEKINIAPNKYFSSNGCVYGPLRKPIQLDFHDYKKVIVVRDPVSTLVSEFISFAYTHPLPGDGVPKHEFMERRQKLLEIGLDGYAEMRCEGLFERFTELSKYSKNPYSFIVPFELLMRDRLEFIKIFYNSIGSCMSAHLAHGLLTIYEGKRGPRNHRSRLKDFKSVRLSPALSKNIHRHFRDHKHLWSFDV
jgi:hypothetical protein